MSETKIYKDATEDSYVKRILNNHDVLYLSDHVGLVGSTVDVVCYGSDSKWYVNGHATMVKGTNGISNTDFGLGTGLVMYTNDDVSSDVGSISSTLLSYNPARSKSVSNISIAFKFSKEMQVGNKFYIHLPDLLEL